MFTDRLRRLNLISPSEAAILVHSRWLSAAISARFDVPRIPTRAVRDGGFNAEMMTTDGRMWAQEWWERALSMAD